MTGPYFIGSEIYRRFRYAGRHPLNIPRVSTVTDLCRALGWLTGDFYRDSPVASLEQLIRFHEPDYLAALMRIERDGKTQPGDHEKYNIGGVENPLFSDLFSRPATAAGGTLMAVELVAKGGVAYHPAGGTHHGRPGRASGFCYLNDPVLGILAFLDRGYERVLYVDLDAHHPDGVEDAFCGDPRVRMISIHEEGRWPFSGGITDRAQGSAFNFAVPRGFNDSEFDFLLDEAVLPLAAAFGADALYLQCGADALANDPLSRMNLSNGALWRGVARLTSLAPRVIVSGGGGYNPWSVARGWAGVWATIAGFTVPDVLPPRAEAILRGLSWAHRLGKNPPESWFTTLADPRISASPEDIRPEIRALVAGHRVCA